MADVTGVSEEAVIFVPGIVNPVRLSYGPLLDHMHGDRRFLLKELEVYRLPEPPDDYSVETEVAGIRRLASEAGIGSFHLVGYSAGGLAALGYIHEYPQQLRSVTLIEQFGTGNQDSPDEAAFLEEAARVVEVPAGQRVAAFLPLNLRPGVAYLPQTSPPPAWMSQRPAGITALVRSARAARFDQARFRAFNRPVYVALGSLSNEVWQKMAANLRLTFPDIEVEVYNGLHHLNPPQRAVPEHFGAALRRVWARADSGWAGSGE